MKLSLGKDAPIIRPLLQHLSEKWYILGTLLGFDQDALKKIASVAGSAESYLEQVITMWLCGDSAKPPTLESLIAALRDAAVGGGEVITRLLKGIQVIYSYTRILYKQTLCIEFQHTMPTMKM